MEDWLLYVLIAVGVLLLVALVLYLTGKQELAKKIVLPFTLLLGAVAAVLKVVGPGQSAIAKENARIKQELKKIQEERAALQQEIAEKTRQFEQEAAVLKQQIGASDAKAAALQQEVARMQAEGAAAWFAGLSEEEKKELLKKTELPGLPDEFLRG